MGSFSYHRFIFLIACIDRWKIYNRLVSACTTIKVKCLCASTSKKRHSCRTFLFACAAINRVNLAFRTTIIKATHLTLAVIPFEVEANNSLIFLALQTYEKEKKFVEFPFLLVYNSLINTSQVFGVASSWKQCQMRRQLPFPGSAEQGITDYTNL